MTANPRGVVVVGTGFGCRIHVPALREAGFDVVGLVGADADRTRRRADRAGIAHAGTSLTEALRVPHADVVIVATPPDTHAELAEEAVAAGRHVLVEKPFTLDAPEAHRLVDAANAAGVVALVGHEFRFAPERVTFGDAVNRGLVGTPRLATFIGHTSFLAAFGDVMPGWWYEPGRGGWLGAAVSHRIDAVHVWLGEIASLSAALPARSADTAEDSVSVRFRLQSGCEAVLQESAAVWGPGLSITSVAGTHGTVAITADGVTLATADGTRTLEPAGPPLPVTVPRSDDPRKALHHIELEPAIAQAMALRGLVAGRPPADDLVAPATFRDGAACMEVLDAIRRSAAAGGAECEVRRAG
ncbi:MAG TPA: Gfo/Idh/MocA family oxidoreductase [Mycobacteriales bacterium]|nr:Gfo/Idh/MocA family oxidoreductase [Mycobacteriales bacterium]